MMKHLDLVKAELCMHPRQPLGMQPQWQPDPESDDFRKILSGSTKDLDFVRSDFRRHGMRVAEMAGIGWLDRLSNSENTLIHLARSFARNAELMVLERPTHNFMGKLKD